MVIVFLLALAISASAFAMQRTYHFKDGLSLNDFLTMLQDAQNERTQAVNDLPHAQMLLEILQKGNASPEEIFNPLFALKPEEIAALKPLQGNLKPLIKPPLRAAMTAYIAQQRRGSFEKGEVARINAINEVFSFTKTYFKSSIVGQQPSKGFYTTDQGWMVEIDHEEVTIGQQTNHGKIVAINR